MSMYKVEIDKEGYALHIVENKAGNAQLTVMPARGGIITSLKLNGQEVFYFDRSTLDSPEGVRGGNPVLFPVCGRLTSGCYKAGDKTYNMPLHGFAGNLPWKVKQAGEQPEPFIQLELAAGNLSKSFYPYSFRVVLTYVLTGSSLCIKQEYFNEGTEEMPFYSGFHPYFLVGDKSRLSFEVNSDHYFDYVAGRAETYTGNIDFGKPVDFVFTLNDKNGSKYAIVDPDLGRKLVIQNEAPFKYMVMWTEEGKNFVCVEPWMAAPDALNTGKDLQLVQPGKSLKTSTVYTLESL